MATNQNLFGYIPTESVDWSKALGGLYTTVKGIEEGREELKLELDQLKTDNIKTIQQKLGVPKPDGVYGPVTKKAVVAFQKANPKLGAADGVVGPKTWAAIIKLK